MSDHLVVFAKHPQPGAVKTRLCPPLTPDQAARLAGAFLRDVLSTANRLPHVTRTLAYAPRGKRAQMARIAGPGWKLRLQIGRDLGERMGRMVGALHGLEARGTKVFIIGSDSPQLPADRLEEAFTALDEADMVLGPCNDGGYYLVGFSRWVEGVFDAVRWSTEHALADTLGGADGAGLTVRMLVEDYDVDDEQSLRRLAGGAALAEGARLQHTKAALADIGWLE